MELKVNIEYNEILNLIQQMPEKDIQKLADLLKSRVSEIKNSGESIKELLLEAPVWTDEDYNQFKLAHESINKSRIA